MLNNKRTILLLSLGLASIVQAAGASAAGLTGTSADFGVPVPTAVADRQIDVGTSTKSVNVTDGESVKFNVNGQSFTWHFDTFQQGTVVDLSKIAPPDAGVQGVQVYVAPSETYAGG
jgi:hypothetical protein